MSKVPFEEEFQWHRDAEKREGHFGMVPGKWQNSNHPLENAYDLYEEKEENSLPLKSTEKWARSVRSDTKGAGADQDPDL